MQLQRFFEQTDQCLVLQTTLVFTRLLAAGDQSANLEWRIFTGGEFPTIHMPKTVVILIGTNDLTYADCDDDQQEILDAAPGIVDRCGATVCS
jgi:hypothetical protein